MRLPEKIENYMMGSYEYYRTGTIVHIISVAFTPLKRDENKGKSEVPKIMKSLGQ